MARKDEEREKRLAEALRENLKRRKQQARATQGSARPVGGALADGDEHGGG